MTVTTEVVDDEEQHMVSAGSIIASPSCGLERESLDIHFGGVDNSDVEEVGEDAEEPELIGRRRR